MGLLDHPRQLAYAVDDVRAAAERWAQGGVGPFFINEHIPVSNARIFDEPGEFDHSSAYAQWGPVMVELIVQHHPGPKPVVAGGGLHHVAFFVDEFAGASTELINQGFDEVLYAEAGEMPFALFDARHELGHLIEIYPRTDRLVGFYEMVEEAAHRWDGTDPLRSASSPSQAGS